MRRILFGLVLMLSVSASAQKFAFVDMEYILNNIPNYEMANEQLEQISRTWQAEVESVAKEAETMYKNYQAELVFLSDEMKLKKEEEILNKEKELQNLRVKYFGPEGELYKKREALIVPIQEDIYEAVKEISAKYSYSMVLDRATSNNIIYASPKIDISNEVLSRLGYSK